MKDAVAHYAGMIQDFISICIGFILGALFGLIRHAQDFTGPPEQRPKCSWWILLIKGITAGGVGVLATLLTLEWKVDPYLSNFLIAVAGWGGVETLNAFKEAVYDAIRRKVNATIPIGTPKDTTDDEAKV